MKKLKYLFLLSLIFLSGCSCDERRQQEAQVFLDEYTAQFVDLYTESSEATWKFETYLLEGDTATENRSARASEKMAAFTGSESAIKTAQYHLKFKEFLKPIQVKQLERILYAAGDNPATVPDLVKKRIAASNAQTKKMYGYEFLLEGKSVTPNELVDVLVNSEDEEMRRKAWESSKAVGAVLKEGLVNLRGLRNETVQALGHNDYFTYQVSDYGMDVDTMKALMDKQVQEVWPLYRELHTWARYELAEKYRAETVPDYLPAHWLPNRWGQDWQGLVEVEGIDLDARLEEKGDKWLIEQAERFYVSLGFDELPATFYERSSLYPAPDTVDWKKNTHASAWHLNLDRDVRCLMSLVPTADWYETTHHELGHIYYFLEYSNDTVPPLLREGANRGYHEAMGSLLGLAAMQKPFLQHLELIPADVETDETQLLLKEALNYIVFIPWSAGVMTHYEHDLYRENLSPDEFNARWWDYKKQYQGIAPPAPRSEFFCDAASKTHINDDAAQYYDYAISYILLFQFHDHIAKNILKQDPRATNYFGNKEVGAFLKKVMHPGATRDWRVLLKESTGEDLSARAMLEYFSPLMDYLKKENEGRNYTLPATFDPNS